jgi:DNA-binding XRE family transcriptional regulator
LIISETGVSNLKGKTVSWYYPIHDIYSIEREKNDPSIVTVKIIKSYTFITNGEKESMKIEEVFKEIISKKNKKKKVIFL